MLGSVNFDLGDHEQALACFEGTRRIEEAKLGEDHPETAVTYSNIASVYHAQGEYEQALAWHNKALAITEAKLGKDHPDTASTYGTHT